MSVWCGMIMGFDSDDLSIFDRQIDFIQQSRISFSMSDMLWAIPKTPLHDRLREEGRLDLDDRPVYGSNVIPLQMTREELRDGYVRVLNTLYDPENYFARTEALFLESNFEVGNVRAPYWKKHPFRRLALEATDAVRAAGLYYRIMTGVTDPELKKEYRLRFKKFLKVRKRPTLVVFYLFHIAMHYHAYTMAKNMTRQDAEILNSY